jgi:hypothetical protein
MIYGTQNVFLGVSECGSSNFTAVADDVVASTTGPIGPELPAPTTTPTSEPSPSSTPTPISLTVTPTPTPSQTTSQSTMGDYLSVIASIIILGALIFGIFFQRRKN